jgi:hypothetical protein
MKTIDQLIFDALAARQSVTLPGIGSLEVKRKGARKISDTELEPPYNDVVLTPAETDDTFSVVSLVMNGANMDEKAAVALYGAWLEDALRPDGNVIINGVGETKEGKFLTAVPMYKQLNPDNEKIVTMETKKGSTPTWVWIIVALLAALLVAGAIYCWKTGVFNGGKSRKAVVETIITGTAADSLALAEEEGASGAEGAAASGAAGAARATGAPKTPAPRTPAGAGGRFHIIAGAFSIESNADKFVSDIKRQYPELTPQKIVNPASGYFMVSILSESTQRAAANKMNLYWDINLNLWVYEQR